MSLHYKINKENKQNERSIVFNRVNNGCGVAAIYVKGVVMKYLKYNGQLMNLQQYEYLATMSLAALRR